MSSLQRLTYSTAVVLQALEGGHRYGFDIIEAVGVRSGTVYPLLRRLQEGGLVSSRWESVKISRASNRPPRRYYELTRAGVEAVAHARERFPWAPAREASHG